MYVMWGCQRDAIKTGPFESVVVGAVSNRESVLLLNPIGKGKFTRLHRVRRHACIGSNLFFSLILGPASLEFGRSSPQCNTIFLTEHKICFFHEPYFIPLRNLAEFRAQRRRSLFTHNVAHSVFTYWISVSGSLSAPTAAGGRCKRLGAFVFRRVFICMSLYVRHALINNNSLCFRVRACEIACVSYIDWCFCFRVYACEIACVSYIDWYLCFRVYACEFECVMHWLMFEFSLHWTGRDKFIQLS